MKAKILLILTGLFFSANVLAVTSSYEWHFYGEAMVNKKNNFLFYSSNIKINNQHDTLKVWTKIVPTEEIQNSYILNKKKIANDTQQKVITLIPNHPEIYKVNNKNDKTLSLMLSEYIVNKYFVDQQMQVLNELDCRKEKIRILAAIQYKSDKTPIENDDANSKWRYIAPQTLDNSLMSWVCKK